MSSAQPRSVNWYPTLSPPWYQQYPYWLPNSYAPASPYSDFGRDDSPGFSGHSSNNNHMVESPMTILMRPLSYHNYGTGELIKVNTKGFALLGLLGLMAIFQGLLNTVVMLFTTTTDAPTATATTAGAAAAAVIPVKLRSRRGFDTVTFDPDTGPRKHGEKILLKLIPHLNSIAHAHSGLIPFHCAVPSLCTIRETLLTEYPLDGNELVGKLFTQIAQFWEDCAPAQMPVVHRHKIHAVGQFVYFGLDPCAQEQKHILPCGKKVV